MSTARRFAPAPMDSRSIRPKPALHGIVGIRACSAGIFPKARNTSCPLPTVCGGMFTRYPYAVGPHGDIAHG
jgi:hypothetical protein